MFFVDNKIPDGKLRKILDTVSTVLFLLFALLLLFAENVCFRHHRKFDQRILETTARMAINNHDLAGAYDTVLEPESRAIRYPWLLYWRRSFTRSSKLLL